MRLLGWGQAPQLLQAKDCLMEIKIVLKDGERSGTFKFAGDPLDIIKGVTDQFSGVWGSFLKFVEDDGVSTKET